MIETDLDIDLTTAVLGAIENAISQVWTALPAEVTSYDKDTQRATVRLLVKDVEPVRTIPPIPGVPVVFPRAAGYAVVLPVEEGDTGLLLVCALSPNTWLRSGSAGAPQDTRRHALSSAVFLPGLSREAITNPPDVLALGHVGRMADAQPVALGDKVDALFAVLNSAFTAGTPGPSEPGFAAFKAAWISGLAPFSEPQTVGSTDVVVTTEGII